MEEKEIRENNKDSCAPPPPAEEAKRYYLNLDEDDYLLSAGYQSGGEGPSLDSIEDCDFSGSRLGAYRWDGENLIFDAERYAALERETAREAAVYEVMELNARLRQSDSVVLEAMEGLLGATTLTGLLAALVEAARSIRTTLTERAGLREQIEKLREET